MRLLVLLLAVCALRAADEVTVYDLLAPATHSFDIVYGVTATREGAPYFFNPIRTGSVATKERVIDRATGKRWSSPWSMARRRKPAASSARAPPTMRNSSA